ncbi:hypothetical protein C5Y93_06765 [Blastopirellula marina]|uniref:Uncharacterized protein n=1 Tax=Blastopirellula marina TaxID=124 RepID=A0A2S8GQZ2_9BACT|nr:hypothetical protein C5Y93_06765 [Blastopirellula marina]
MRLGSVIRFEMSNSQRVASDSLILDLRSFPRNLQVGSHSDAQRLFRGKEIGLTRFISTLTMLADRIGTSM